VGAETDPSALDRVGRVLNEKWKLERLLGVGGMAAVYAGLHRNGARAAIKVLHPELARHKEVRQRFQREGYAANKVEHDGVVKVLDDDVVSSGPDAGTAYLVMELLEGESLQDRLERGQPIDEREFLEMALGVLEVLEAAHQCGVVHRDIKPENLFFAREDDGMTHIKVLDFGLARLQQAEAITTYGLALGTPSFMSPEQAAGRTDEIDGRTDLFALAAAGFRLRTGRRIHEEEDVVELVKKMARLPASPIRSIAPGTSKPFARVIDRALQFKRENRYESAAAMRADVGRALAELEGEPRDAGAGEPTIELSASDFEPSPRYGVDESIRIPKRRSILPWLALLLCGGAAAMFWRDPGWLRSAWPIGTSASSAPTPDASGAPGADAGGARPRASATHRPAPARPAGSGTH
jgi:serine/threonine protein kinase